MTEMRTVPTFSERLDELEPAVRARTQVVPRIGIVLGSGLGGLADALTDVTTIPFSDLPGWPAASAPGHAGSLLIGNLEGVPVVVPEGPAPPLRGQRRATGRRARAPDGPARGQGDLPEQRRRRYQRELPRRNPDAHQGPLNLTGRSPLIGANDDALGARFPDLVNTYSPRLRTLMRRAATEVSVPLEEGVYAGLTGPTYETPAEVRMLATLGADAVGMSTVLEAIVAHWAGMEVVAVSLVTNPGAG